MRYDQKTKSFLLTPKQDVLELELGDTKQDIFLPQYKIMRWGNEVNFSARLQHTENNINISENNNKVVWGSKNIEAHFYQLPETEEHIEGANELEILLLKKPSSNKVIFTINTKGLIFLYQDKLTSEERAQGCHRPENVVGSYAVYASDDKINYEGGVMYGTGKVGHIYRPRIEDATGKQVWGDLNIDTEKGLLIVTIPQEFINTAVYPIKHAAGLTFGYTSQGASEVGSSAGADHEVAMRGIGLSGNVTQLAGYFKSSAGFYLLQLRNETSNAPGNTVHVTSGDQALSGGSYALRTYNTNYTMTGLNYWVYGYPSYNGQVAWVAYDSGGGSAGSGAIKIDFGAWSTNTNRYSIYATYSAPPANIVVSGAGTSGVNGIYSYRGTSNSKNYYNKLGESNDVNSNSIVWYVYDVEVGSRWGIRSSDGSVMYYSYSDTATPDLASSWAAYSGSNPAPSVQQVVLAFQSSRWGTISGISSLTV